MVFPKVNAGQRVKLSATYLNRLTDLANTPTGNVAAALSGNSQPHLIQIKNTTGVDVIPQGILGLGDSLVDPDDDEMAFRFGKPVLSGETPVLGTHDKKFCIVQGGLAVDEIGPAQVFGFAQVKIDILDVNHEYATIAEESANDATELLESAVRGPARIIWVATGPDSGGLGEAWALIEWPHSASTPDLWATTSAEASEEITIKALDIDGSVGGSEFTVPVSQDIT